MITTSSPIKGNSWARRAVVGRVTKRAATKWRPAELRPILQVSLAHSAGLTGSFCRSHSQAHSAGLTGSFCRSHSQAHSADLTGSERVARGKALVIKSKIQVLSGVCDKIEHILEYVMI